MTTHSWDENPNGAWTLEIENVAGASDYGNTFSSICEIQEMNDLPAGLCFHLNVSVFLQLMIILIVE